MSEILKQFSDGLASAVETAGQAVVRVEARRRIPASGILWSADGLIVTAHHVVEQDDNIGIGLAGGQSLTATLVGRDPTTDLAVLRAGLPAGHPPLTSPTLAQADSLRVGHFVLALGRPGQRVMATLGVISALGDSWRTPAGGEVDRYVQTDVVMYPGFSGGPLVDVNGQVVGLNTSALARGVSLTLPIPTVQRVVETLLSHGRVRRGYLGITAQAARLPAALAGQLGQETGLLIGSVENGGPAEKAGLFMGDTVVALDGQAVRQLDDLLALLTGERVGHAVTVRFVRGGQVHDVAVTVAERPA